MNAEETKAALLAVADAVIAAEPILTDADRAIGDGDHGIGMRRGFLAVKEKLEAERPATPGAVMKITGMVLLSKTGGAAGAVFGSFFRAGGLALGDPETLDAAGFRAFLTGGRDAVMKRGGAAEGDKTMLDPLAYALRAGCESTNLADALTAAAAGAKEGVEATKGMVAGFGKAKALGKRSLGHPDPGAVSLAIILEALQSAHNA